jgi:hypothetical protein
LAKRLDLGGTIQQRIGLIRRATCEDNESARLLAAEIGGFAPPRGFI